MLGFPTDWEEYATKFTEGDSTSGIHSGTISDSGKFASHLASNICTTSLFGSYLVSKICVIFLLTYPIILLIS